MPGLAGQRPIYECTNKVTVVDGYPPLPGPMFPGAGPQLASRTVYCSTPWGRGVWEAVRLGNSCASEAARTITTRTRVSGFLQAASADSMVRRSGTASRAGAL